MLFATHILGTHKSGEEARIVKNAEKALVVKNVEMDHPNQIIIDSGKFDVYL